MVTQLTEDNLQDLVTKNEKVLVLYGNKPDPFFEELSFTSESVKFIFVDAGKYPRSKRLALVRTAPTFAAFKNGKIVAQVASPQKDTLKRLLAELK